MKTVKNFLMVAVVMAGFAVKAQAATFIDLTATGRLLEANCNAITGLADVAMAVYEPRNNTMSIRKYNLVNESLCSKNPQGFVQRLTDMTFSSLTELGADGARHIRLHKITFNIQSIATDLVEVIVDNPKLLKTYQKFSLIDYPKYRVYDQRVMVSEGSHHEPGRAQQVIEMSRQ